MSDDDLTYHVARILILLERMSPRGGTLEGLTKLVKLDFLLRYPQMLDRLLRKLSVTWPNGLEPSPVEQLAVEAPMIRFKYGPWDDRYYPMLGFLSGTGLADVVRKDGAITIRLTKEGRLTARQLAAEPSWQRVAERADLLRAHFNITGNALKEMIYRELPDVVDRPLRTAI